MIDTPELTKPPEKPIREPKKPGKIKKVVKNVATAVALTGSIATTGIVARDSYLNWPSAPVENPKLFPTISSTPNDSDFFNLSFEDKYKYWDDHEPLLTETRIKVENEVSDFLTRVMGHTSPGRGSGPSISRKIIEYDYDWNGHRDMSASWSFTENNLQGGVLEDHASFRVENDDGTRSNNYGLKIDIDGLLMSPDRSQFDLANSNITFVRITDADAKVFDGRTTVWEFARNPNGGFDVRILRPGSDGRLSVVFSGIRGEK